MQSVFFAMLHRLRSTSRWSGMTPLQPEDVAQHSYGVTVIAHALCVIDETICHKTPDVKSVLVASLYHDAAECILTDVIAPVKKYSPEIQNAFSHLENLAEAQLVATLPSELLPVYEAAFSRETAGIADYVHAADKLDALCKCKLEVRRGNQDFVLPAMQIEQSLAQVRESMPCVQYFFDIFMPAFERSVDEYRYLK